jgi:predicted SAM-dependent methyltransferase
MRLNVCCGRQVLEGWTNIDVAQSPETKKVPDLFAPATKIPLPDGCAEEVMVIHGFEHLYRWECDAALEEWKRLLKSGGRLILELPDLYKCCQNILSGFTIFDRDPDQYSYWGLYGDPRTQDPFMTHRWGWTPKTLRKILQEHGFHNILDAATQWHPAGRINRDMRMEAFKP